MFETERPAVEELTRKGFGVITPDQYRIDIDPEFVEAWERARSFTMTSLERGYALWQAIRYLTTARVAGDIVECGVWKGGSCMLSALTLRALGDLERTIYLYDTFAGPTRPSEADRIAWNGADVLPRWEADRRGEGRHFTTWAVGRAEVARNMQSVGWPEERTMLVEGDVAKTLEATLPERIALLRLDTDWYESTLRELELAFPRLVPGGVLIVDDYGHFEGARRAVDEYFARAARPILLNRVDYTGRIGIKLGAGA